MGFYVEIPLLPEELHRVVTTTHQDFVYDESCGEDIYCGDREVSTVELGNLCLMVYGTYAVAHCSYGGSLYDEIVEAIGNRPHIVDGNWTRKEVKGNGI